MKRDHFNNKLRWYLLILPGMIFLLLSSGCQETARPRARLGAFFGSPGGMDVADPDQLGNHRYKFTLSEKNGMVYTCRGGFIDIGHLREAADRTAYIKKLSYQHLKQVDETFSFRVIEPSKYKIRIVYPDNWTGLDQTEKEQITQEASIRLAQYLAQTSLVWHEILTWYGFSVTGIFSEFISSFSCEDTYSDLLGTYLAAKALRTDEGDFDDQMTMLIAEAFDDLDAQGPDVTRKAIEKVDGEWFTGDLYFFVDIKERNFDTGWERGYIRPKLVEGLCENSSIMLLEAVELNYLQTLGFDIDIELEPRVWEKGRIYRQLNMKADDTIRPREHFPQLLEKIKKQAHAEKKKQTNEISMQNSQGEVNVR